MSNAEKRTPTEDTVLTAFARGIQEASSATGITYDNDPTSARSVAYDEGRNFGEAADMELVGHVLTACNSYDSDQAKIKALAEALGGLMEHYVGERSSANVVGPAGVAADIARAIWQESKQ